MPRLPLALFSGTEPVLDLFEPAAGPVPGTPADPGTPVPPETLPPVVYCSEEAAGAWGAGPGPVVVWGWPVLRLVAGSGGDSIYAHERPLGPREALLLALALEGRTGSYSWEEMHRIVAYCERFALDVDPEVSRAAVGDGGLVFRVERYRALPPLLRGALDRGAIDLKTAEALSPPATEGNRRDEVLGKLLSAGEGLSHSNRRKLLLIARELLVSRRSDPRELIRVVEATADAPEELLSQLRALRYPELTGMVRQLNRFTEEHLRGTGVRLEAPPNFEGRRFTVSFDFADSREYSARLAALGRAGERLEAILDLL
ncbi:MAG: hypothetical protein ACOCW6_00380 [Spirochaetota bacterium]